MPRRIEFGGRQIDVPDEASDEQVAGLLSQLTEERSLADAQRFASEGNRENMAAEEEAVAGTKWDPRPHRGEDPQDIRRRNATLAYREAQKPTPVEQAVAVGQVGTEAAIDAV